MEARMAHLEERIRREIRQEREAREKDGAHTDEEIDQLEERIEAVEAEQTRQRHRLTWVEKRTAVRGRPPKAPKK